MPYLFIGGSHDGERVSVISPDRGYVTLPVRPFPVIGPIDRPYPPVEYEEYRYFRIAAETMDFIVYVHSGMSPDQAIEALLKHYCPSVFKKAPPP